MDIERLDERSVVAARTDVIGVSVGDDEVVFDPVHDRTHRLGPVTAMVWRALDRPSSAVALGDTPEAVPFILRQIRRLATARLLAGTESPRPAEQCASVEVGPGRVFELVAPEDCARNNRAGWAGSLAVAAGRHAVGVRCNDAQLLEVLERVLAPVRVDMPEPPPNFSVAGAVHGRAGAPHRLKDGCRSLVRTTSLRRVVAALRSFLSAYEQVMLPERVVIEVVAIVRGTDIVLAPERLRPRLGGAGAELARRGWSIVDGLPAVSGGDVIVEPATLPVDEGALAAVADAHPDPVAAPGRYRLAGWAWPAGGGMRRSAAAEVAAAVNRTVRNRAAVGAEAALQEISAAIDEAPRVDIPVGPVSTDAVLSAMAELG